MWSQVGVVEMPGRGADVMHMSVRLLDMQAREPKFQCEVSVWR